MAEARAHDGGYHDVSEQDAQPAFGSAFMAEHACHDVISQDEAYRECQAIPSHRQRTQAEKDRVGVPIYEIQNVEHNKDGTEAGLCRGRLPVIC